MNNNLETAILAGGCFWGMQDLFRKIPGVVSTRAGYSGGDKSTASYNLIKRGDTGHAESIEIVFDNAKTDFRRILEFFFQIHDPTTLDRQGNDRGSQYRSAIFYMDDRQKSIAAAVIDAVNASGKWPGKVVTEISPSKGFFIAEDHHQDYLEKYPDGYTCHFIRQNWTLS